MIQPRRLNVFLYGLFMDEAALRAKGFDPINSRMASVPGMSLRVGNRATLIEAEASSAHGILTELTHAEIDKLYSDPSVEMYRAEPVTVEFPDGSRAAALCFNLPITPMPSEANPDYAKSLREVAQRLGLPSDYIETIK